MSTVTTDQAWDHHLAGVHDLCAPSQPHRQRPNNVPDNCRYAGYVERFHSHDYSGPLVCGCDDFATE